MENVIWCPASLVCTHGMPGSWNTLDTRDEKQKLRLGRFFNSVQALMGGMAHGWFKYKGPGGKELSPRASAILLASDSNKAEELTEKMSVTLENTRVDERGVMLTKGFTAADVSGLRKSVQVSDPISFSRAPQCKPAGWECIGTLYSTSDFK